MNIGILKGKGSANHRKENDPSTPDVYLTAIVSGASNHLRSSVAWRPTGSFELLSLNICVAEAKVDYLQTKLTIKQDIFKF